MDQKWKTVKQLAKRGDVSDKQVYKGIRSGKLRAVRINGGRSYRRTDDWFDAWMESNATPTDVVGR